MSTNEFFKLPCQEQFKLSCMEQTEDYLLLSMDSDKLIVNVKMGDDANSVALTRSGASDLAQNLLFWVLNGRLGQ